MLCAAGAYHAGFNVGFNCAESTNFATTSWIQHGAAADFCRCSPEQQSVHLDMGLFLAQAPDDHAQALVRQWVDKHQVAPMQKPLKKLERSSRDSYAALESQHGSNWQQDKDGFKPVCKAAVQATSKGMSAAQGTVRGPAAAESAKHKDKESGPMRKPSMGMKVIKKAVKNSKAAQGLAGRADSKVAAAMLKMAKRAELAPSAAAKLPKIKPTSYSSQRLLPGSQSTATARGCPKSSSKARVAADDIAMQGLHQGCDTHRDVTQLQAQHSTPESPSQPFGSVRSADTQLLGKRKRSASATAMPQGEMTSEATLKAMHHQIAAENGQYMSDGHFTKKAKQAAPPRLPHINSAQQIQQAAAQHAQQIQQAAAHHEQQAAAQQAQQADTARYMQQAQLASQAVLMHQMHRATQQAQTQGPEPINTAFVQLQSNPLRTNKRKSVHQATTQKTFTGEVVQDQTCATHLCASAAVQTMTFCMSTAGKTQVHSVLS